jgi:hypothetical protein
VCPILDLKRAGFMRKAMRGPPYRRLWIEDLSYYLYCDWFHGRKPPDLRRLKRSWGLASPKRS